ncbi:MAG: MBL fold metallo-hydrolase [Promethearchaeota archaeon]
MDYLLVIDDKLPNFYFVPGENDGRYPNSHSLLVKTSENNNEAILFDSGIGHSLVKRILKDFKITKVFLSHWHEDHISGNYLLKKQGANFFCHPLDARLLRDISKFQEFYDTIGSPVADFFQEILSTLKLENLTELHKLKNNQEVQVGNAQKIKILHTPGHSAGHCCYYEPENRLVYLADIDLSGLGPWYGCLDSNVDDFEKSIQRLMKMNIEYAISGHKGLFTGKSEIKKQLNNFLEVIFIRDSKILDELSETKSKSIKELIGKGIIYRNYNQWKDYLLIAENQMISKHVSRLIKKKKVSKVEDGFILN